MLKSDEPVTVPSTDEEPIPNCPECLTPVAFHTPYVLAGNLDPSTPVVDPGTPSYPFPVDTNTPISSVGELPNTGGSPDYEGAAISLGLIALVLLALLAMGLVLRWRSGSANS